MTIEQAIWLAPLPIMGITALLTWILGSRIGTRRLGFGVVAALGLALMCLITARVTQTENLDTELLNLDGLTWLAAYSNLREPAAISQLRIHIDGWSFGLLITVMACALLSILTIAQSLGTSLRGYGRLWTHLLIMLIGVFIGLIAKDLLVFAFGWGIAVVGTALARRVVGGDDQRTPVVLTMGMTSLLALLAGIQGLVVRMGDPTSGSYAFDDVSVSMTFLPWLALLLAAALAIGIPPFGRGISSDEGTPPLIHGTLMSLGMPVLGIYLLLRLVSISLGRWPQSWFVILTVIGAITLFVAAAAALRTTRFGPLIGNQMIAQWGITILVLGQFNPNLPLDNEINNTVIRVVILLVIATIWSTLLSTMALGVVERRTGSDFISNQPMLDQPFRAAGWAYSIGALLGLGFPPLIGYMGRRWLLNIPHTEGILPILLGGSVLLAMSYIGPMALFWRINPSKPVGQPLPISGREHDLVLIIASLPIIVWAIVPQIFHEWLIIPALRSIRPLGDITENAIGSNISGQIVAGIMLIFAAWTVWRSRSGHVWGSWLGGEDTDIHQGTPLVPHALGYVTRWVSMLSDPTALFKRLGRSLEQLSVGIAWVEQAFSGRYYLTGILIAALTLMLLLVQ